MSVNHRPIGLQIVRKADGSKALKVDRRNPKTKSKTQVIYSPSDIKIYMSEHFYDQALLRKLDIGILSDTKLKADLTNLKRMGDQLEVTTGSVTLVFEKKSPYLFQCITGWVGNRRKKQLVAS